MLLSVMSMIYYDSFYGYNIGNRNEATHAAPPTDMPVALATVS